MRRTIIMLSAVLVAGCARSDDAVVADSPAAAGMPAPLTFADFAGRWSLQLLGDMSDSVLATYELHATADGSSWTLTPAGSEPIAVRAAVEADSLLIDAGPYKTTNPANVDVTTHAVSRLQGGILVGTFLSQYAMATGDSTIRGRVRGTRIP
ncbi:MAG TPA: hypothetical protein VFZ73_02595 [Gemmatimonadaceae bacterium]